MHERRATDQIFVGWAIYFFLLSWITLGIYPLVIFYRRLERSDLFRDRRLHYYGAVIDSSKQYAEERGMSDATHDDLHDLEHFVKARFADEHQPLRAGLSLFLSLITLGVYGFIATYRLMRFWWQIQLTEQDVDDKLSVIWKKLGIVRYPITFEPVPALNRSFGLHLLLSLVTLGIYAAVWSYRLHTDPEKVYPEFHSAEDTVLNALRNAP
ncbi:DUF4234 domain-containing protein [Streptomyces sp. NPDC017993]|uniref:DUF4234 domain-containing protein n=1 Tax=Streptomyces sp. NPDC017993 TaxID=3365027 RepID=UPI0037934914